MPRFAIRVKVIGIPIDRLDPDTGSPISLVASSQKKKAGLSFIVSEYQEGFRPGVRPTVPASVLA
jgi:hypothetical protein